MHGQQNIKKRILRGVTYGVLASNCS